MNVKHIMQALRSLFVLQKEGRSELGTKDIINNKDFERLCRKLKTLAGVIDTNETIEALKIVTYIGVPKNSTIVQVLLQLIRHNLNELSLSNIIFLEFLLGHYTSVPLADALRIALPIVFEIQLPLKMDRENISSLREYLFFASKNKLSKKSLDLITSNILSCRDISDVKTAKSVIWSLTDLPPSPTFEPVVKKNLDTLLNHIDELSFEDLDITLSKMAKVYEKEYPFFRNKLFCDAVVGHVIDNNLEFIDACFTLRKLDRLGITNNYLIDYIAKIMEENISSLTSDKCQFGMYTLMKYMTKTDHRPPNWMKIKEIMETLQISKSGINWLKFASSLSYLEIFNESIISKCLMSDLEDILRRRRTHIYLYLVIYHSIKMYKPQLLKLIPRNIRTKDFIQYLTLPKDFPLQGALYNAFGGEKYVKTGIYSKEGFFVDHAIIFRKGGFPVSSSFNSTFIEDLDISPENQIVLIVCLQPELYTEENYLKMTAAMSLKVLEDIGYVTVPVCLSSWNALADYEKIPYLVQNIKNKLGEDMMSVKYA
ncbi:hypothetical protein WA026_007909 [Henosepilachna vigintioctopunctata]